MHTFSLVFSLSIYLSIYIFINLYLYMSHYLTHTHTKITSTSQNESIFLLPLPHNTPHSHQPFACTLLAGVEAPEEGVGVRVNGSVKAAQYAPPSSGGPEVRYGRLIYSTPDQYTFIG